MSFPVTTTFAQADPAIPLTTINALIAILNQVVDSQSPSNVIPYIIGSAVPDVADQDKVWIRLTDAGAPLGNYCFFSGVWVREAPAVSARFGFFTGNPSGLFDGNGLGIKGPGPIALDYWGWALVDGNGGRANYSNRFPIFGAMDNDGITGFAGGVWRTNVTGSPLNTGGESEVTLDANTTYRPEVNVAYHDATGESQDDSGDLYGKIQGGTEHDIGSANTTPDPISIVPPFAAMAFIQFVGYT